MSNNAHPVLRAAFSLRSARPRLPCRSPLQRRFQTPALPRRRTYDENAKSFHPAATGAIAGAIIAFATCYTWYQLSGVKSVVKGSQETKKYLDSVQRNFQQSSPNPDQILKWLRQLANSYAAYVPGASGVVNTAFDELDRVHASHRDEVDAIISECYIELQQVSQRGLSVDAAKQGWQIILKHLRRVHDLTGNAMTDLLDRQPELKDKFGRSVDRLRQMGDRVGPEAKRIIEPAWKQASDLAKSVDDLQSPANIARVQKILDDAAERVRQLAEEKQREAMDQAKPWINKAPELKRLIDQNVTILWQADPQELLKQIQIAASSGNLDGLHDYLASIKRKSGGTTSFQDAVRQISGGDSVIREFDRVLDAAERHGKEAEALLKSTVAEVSQLLARKAEEARRIGEAAERNGGSATKGSSTPVFDSPSPTSSSSSSWFGRR